ncbi:MAG TPA: CopD family protein [Methylibium sp.]|nr:CopD family protein [Methylibium sp.]
MIRAVQFALLASALGCWLAARLADRLALGDVPGRFVETLARTALALTLIVQAALVCQHGLSLLSGAEAEGSVAAAFAASSKTWVGRVSYAQGALVLLGLGMSFRRAWARAVIGVLLGALACTALSGHAVSSRESGVVSTAAVAHILLAALWFGGLGPLWVAHRAARSGSLPVRWAALLQVFSKAALPTMLGILASGTVLAWWSVGRWAALVATPYGWMLLTKLVAVAVVLSLATRLRRWLAASERGERAVEAESTRRWLTIECLFACGVVAAAGSLAGLVPAAHDRIQWPFGFRMAPEAAWLLRSEQIRWPLAAAAALLLLGGTTAVGSWRRHRRAAIIVGLGSLAASAALALPAMAVDAYPTTYSASAAAYETSSVAEGGMLYQRLCVACHGANARGDGPLAVGLEPRPADLTEPHLGWHTHGDVFWWLTRGVPDSAMPGFESATTDVERWHLINYLTALSLGHQARNLGTRPVFRDPWLAAIDFRFRLPDGSYALLSDLRRSRAALVVLIQDAAELPRVRSLSAQAPRLAALSTRVIVVLPQRFSAALGSSMPLESLDIVVDERGDIAAAWAHYRRSLATPDFRDERVAVPRIEFLVDRFGFVRARWRADEGPGEPTADQLVQAVTALASEPELESPDVHAH